MHGPPDAPRDPGDAPLPIYLNEDQAGRDPHVIAYPHVLLCAGVTVLLSDGSLAGCHFVEPGSEQQNGNRLAHQIALSGQQMLSMYMTCNFNIHVNQFGSLNAAGKAALINFHGDVYCYDTAAINPQHGTFIAIRSRGHAHRPRILYKRDEKMLYRDPDFLAQLDPADNANVVGGLNTQSGNPMHRASYLVDVQRIHVP